MNEQAPKSSGGCGKVAIGCGIALLVLVIILAVGGWFLWKNARSLGASAFAYAVNQAVDQSTLPDEQKQTIKTRVDFIKEEFAAGNITLEEISQAMNNLEIERLIGAGIAQYVGTGMIGSSQLSEEQKAAGQQALNRVAHGLLDGQISVNEVQNIFTPLQENPGSDDMKFKSNPTPEELTQVVDSAKELADKADIPEDIGEVDFGAKVNEAFDQALGITQP